MEPSGKNEATIPGKDLIRKNPVELDVVSDLKHLELVREGLNMASLLNKLDEKEKLIDIGLINMGEDKYKDAAQFFKKAIRLDHEAWDCYEWLVHCMLSENKEQEAIQIYQHLKTKYPESIAVLYIAAQLLEHRKQYDKALKLRRYILNIETTANSFCKISNIYKTMNLYEEAYECDRRTVDLNPYCVCARGKILDYHWKKYKETKINKDFENALSEIDLIMKYFPLATIKYDIDYKDAGPYFNYYMEKIRKKPENTGKTNMMIYIDYMFGNLHTPQIGKYGYIYISYISTNKFRRLGWVTQKLIDEFGEMEHYLQAHIVYKGGSEDKYSLAEDREKYRQLAGMYLDKAKEMEPENPLLKLYE